MANILNTILHYPAAVQLPAEPFGWRTVAWADFAEANPDIADEVAIDIALRGYSLVGGGAAPLIKVRGA